MLLKKYTINKQLLFQNYKDYYDFCALIVFIPLSNKKWFVLGDLQSGLLLYCYYFDNIIKVE